MVSLILFKSENKILSGYVYDAVWLYALALEKLVQKDDTYLQNLHSNRSSDAFVQIIKDIDFTGVSGRINFPGRSSRLSDIDIIQWQREGDTLQPHNVGLYKPDYIRCLPAYTNSPIQVPNHYNPTGHHPPPPLTFLN